MAALSITEHEVLSEEAVDGIKIALVIYLLSVHHPRAYRLLQWSASSVEYAEKIGKQLVRITIEGVLLKVTGISDAIEVLF